jgi:hypothetical protein
MVYDLPHTVALLHTIVEPDMSLATHPEHNIVAYDDCIRLCDGFVTVEGHHR